MGKHFVLKVILTTVLLLSACSTPGPNVEPKDGSGHVVVAFRMNGAGVYPHPLIKDYPYYDSLVVERLDTSGSQRSEYALFRWETGIGREALLIGTVPEGRYRLKEGASYVGEGDARIRVSIPIQDELGEFEVIDNTVTDLGVITSTLTPTEGGWVGLHGRLPADYGLDVYVRGYLEETEQRMPLKGKVGWLARIPSQTSMRHLEYGRQRPHFSGPPLLDSANRLIFPTMLGDLVARMPDGGWHRLPTGSDGALWSVAESDSGFYMGGSYGSMLHASDLFSNEWESMSGFSPQDDVLKVQYFDGDLYAVVLNRELRMTRIQAHSGRGSDAYYPDTRLALYRLSNDGEEWREIAGSKLPLKLHIKQAVELGGDILIRWESENLFRAGIHRVNLESADIQILKENKAVRRWHISPYAEGLLLIDSTSGATYRDLTVVDRDLVPVDSGEHSEIFDEIDHIMRPVRLPDGRIVAFGSRYHWYDAERVYERLEGATVEEDGEEVPYDPRKGSYYLYQPGEGWSPFAISPEGCYGRLAMLIVEERLIQRCQFGGQYGVPIGQSEWEKEELSVGHLSEGELFQ